MRKILAITLSVLMILSVLPMSAIAAVAETDVAKIGDTGYATLDEAVQAAQDGDTIVLLKDASMTKGAQRDTGSYTIDGSNRTYTVTIDAIVQTKNCDITFKGCNIITNPQNNDNTRLENENNMTGDMTFDNCLITAASMGIKHTGRGNITFTNNSEMNMMMPIYFRGDHADVTDDQCNFTVENSTIRMIKGQNHPTNGNVLHFNSNNATYKLNLRGNAVIENATTLEGLTNSSGVIAAGNGNINGKLIVNSDPTAKLVVSAKNACGADFLKVHIKDGKTFATELNGSVQLVAAAEVAAKGVKLPEFGVVKSADGATTYNLWSDGTTKYAPGQTYTGGTVTFVPATGVVGMENMTAYIEGADGNKTGYVTLDAAVDAVADGQTIVLLKDATLSRLKDGNLSYTIDGNNKTYTVSTGAATINVGNSNVTFKGVKLDMGVPSGKTQLQIDTDKTGHIIFDNCHVRAYNNSFVKLNGRGNFTLKDTLYEKMTGDATTFYFRGDHADVTEDQCVITIENTHIVNHAGSKSQIQNNNIFHLNSSAGSNFKFFLKGNTVIENASETADGTVACLFHNQQASSTMTLNVEPTVKFVMNATSELLNNIIFVYGNPTATTVIKGAPIFEVNDNVAMNGFKFLADGAKIEDGNGGSLLGFSGTYTEGGADVFVPVVVDAGGIDKGFAVKAVYFTEDDFVMLNGAGYMEGGIAFGFSVSDSLIEALGDGAEFCIMIAPTEYTQFGFNDEMLSLSQRIVLSTDAAGLIDGGEGTKKCILGFKGIPTNNYDAKHVELSAIGFIRYKVGNAGDGSIFTANTYSTTYAELAAAAAK